ncbi:MAG TPA: hypothetical protein VM328_08215 [Fimbriimonadaceae bacterium]|nr:hypothetical protein [Fimbriimonadaceae bacterium]
MRYVDLDVDRARWRFTLSRRLNPRLSLGAEVNPEVGEVGPLLNWVVQQETAERPLITMGTSSDRIGTPRGYHSAYITVARSLPELRIAPYLSVSYSGYEKGLVFPFGCNVSLARNWDLMAMNDGRRSHLLLTYKGASFSVTLMSVWLQRFGIGVSWGF